MIVDEAVLVAHSLVSGTVRHPHATEAALRVLTLSSLLVLADADAAASNKVETLAEGATGGRWGVVHVQTKRAAMKRTVALSLSSRARRS